MAINPNTNFTAGQVATADQMNRFPRGVMGYGKRTAGNVVFSAAQDLTGMTVTFTAVTGRVYRASWLTTGQKSGSTGYTAIYCFVGATNIAAVYDTVGINEYWNCSASAVITGQSGSVTVKLRGESQSNNSTLFAGGDPAYLVIEDIGAE
jgi:hypothetical protein